MTLLETHVSREPAGADHELFAEAAKVSLHPDVRAIGSVARAAMMSTALEDRRPSGLLRDIDIVRFGDRGDPPQTKSGRDVDVSFERWISADRTHLVFPYDDNLQVPVKHIEVFDPYDIEIKAGTVRTVHPDVLGKINTMQFIQRPKDKASAAQFKDFLSAQNDRLHPELLEPFDAMHDALGRRFGYRVRGALRGFYHGLVSEQTRRKIMISHRVPGIGVGSNNRSSH